MNNINIAEKNQEVSLYSSTHPMDLISRAALKIKALASMLTADSEEDRMLTCHKNGVYFLLYSLADELEYAYNTLDIEYDVNRIEKGVGHEKG